MSAFSVSSVLLASSQIPLSDRLSSQKQPQLLAMATSAISAVGSFVVNFCMARPGLLIMSANLLSVLPAHWMISKEIPDTIGTMRSLPKQSHPVTRHRTNTKCSTILTSMTRNKKACSTTL